jgi:hypothetical protein
MLHYFSHRHDPDFLRANGDIYQSKPRGSLSKSANKTIKRCSVAVCLTTSFEGSAVNATTYLCIIYNAFSPTAPTGTNRIKPLSIILIQILNVYSSSINHPVVQAKSYFCCKKSTGHADQDISHLLRAFFPSCERTQTYDPWELFGISCCLYSDLTFFLFLHIHGLHTLASTLSDFLWSALAASTTDFSF